MPVIAVEDIHAEETTTIGYRDSEKHNRASLPHRQLAGDFDRKEPQLPDEADGVAQESGPDPSHAQGARRRSRSVGKGPGSDTPVNEKPPDPVGGDLPNVRESGTGNAMEVGTFRL